VREEKIAALKARIAEGKYKVDADKVADRMVDDHLQMTGAS
jgi:flagellar biosynthesis anti-sigma factor FlgM